MSVEVTTNSDKFSAVLRNNPAWGQLLGLCPLLAVSNSVSNALGLALASLLVLFGANVTIAATKRLIPSFARLPLYMLVIASFTTLAVLLLEAYAYPVYVKVALFVQIIVTNCMILARVEQFASKSGVISAGIDALATGLGFTIALLTLGAARELVAQGTLGAGLESLLGGTADTWTWHLIPAGWQLPVAGLPPGAFILAGLLLGIGIWLTRLFTGRHSTTARNKEVSD